MLVRIVICLLGLYLCILLGSPIASDQPDAQEVFNRVGEQISRDQSVDRSVKEPHVDGPASEVDASAPESGGNEKAEGPQVTTEDLKRRPNEEYQASIIQILAHRDRYHGKEVQITGYLRVQFEGTAIYLSKEDADYLMTRNGFWVDLSEEHAKYDRKYVLIEGTFDKESMGHMSLWQGTITNVTRMFELTKDD